MDNNITKEEIIFTNDDVDGTISEMLKKVGLHETVSDLADMDDVKNSLIVTVFKLAKDFAKGVLSEKDFTLALQSQLKIPNTSAESLTKDIKEKLLPKAEKVKIAPEPQKTEAPVSTVAATNNQAINNAPIRPANESVKMTEPAIKAPVTPSRPSPIERKPRTTKGLPKPDEIIEKEPRLCGKGRILIASR